MGNKLHTNPNGKTVKVPAGWKIGEGANISPKAKIGSGAAAMGSIGECAVIRAGAKIESFAEIGDRCVIASGATISHGAVIGNDTEVGAHSFVDIAVPSELSLPAHSMLRLNSDAIFIDGMGIFGVTAMCVRTRKDGKNGHRIKAGCWYGSLGQMRRNLDRPYEFWTTPGHTAEEYRLLADLFEARINRWKGGS